MRKPFQLPSGCPAISVVNVELGSMPYCAVPSITEPAFEPRVNVTPPPDIAPPDSCVCLDVDVTTFGKITYADKPVVKLTWMQKPVEAGGSGDCCDGEYLMQLSLDVPCLPLAVTGGGSASISDRSDAALDVNFKRSTTVTGDAADCALDLGVALDIPCVPFDPEPPAQIPCKVTVGGTTGGGRLTLGLVKNGCDVAVGGELSLHLPFVAVKDGIDGIDGVDGLDGVDGITPAIPCVLIDVKTSGGISVKDVKTPRMVMSWLPTPGFDICDGMYGMRLSLDVPCMPFRPLPAVNVNTNVQTRPVKGAGGALRLGLVENNCELRISGDLDLYVPDACNPLVVSTQPKFVRKAVTEPAIAIKFVRKATEPCDQQYSMAVSMAMPCIPFTPKSADVPVKVVLTNDSSGSGKLTLALVKNSCDLKISGLLSLALPAGIVGPVGPRGYRGYTGERGPAGIKGDKGDKGDRGYPGDKGDKGDKGDRGDDGTNCDCSGGGGDDDGDDDNGCAHGGHPGGGGGYGTGLGHPGIGSGHGGHPGKGGNCW